MDHEFGTSFLEREQQGWDWLSLQFDDGRELMLYQLRRPMARAIRGRAARWWIAEGRTTHLTADAFTMVADGPRRSIDLGRHLPHRLDGERARRRPRR